MSDEEDDLTENLMSTATLTKTAKTGQQIEVHLVGNEFAVTLDGKPLCSGGLVRLQKPQNGATHHIDGKVGFTAPEVEVLNAAFRAANPTPLRYQREGLVASLRGLQAEQDGAYERGHHHDGSAAYAAAKPWEAKIEAARTALAQFDAAHPEVLTAIRAEKAERLSRTEQAD